jgi:hypothetical protein
MRRRVFKVVTSLPPEGALERLRMVVRYGTPTQDMN